MQLEGRKALVTGAQQGIGHAVALAMAKAGADVAINYLDDEAAAIALAGEIQKLGRKTALIQGDLSVFAVLAPLVAEAEARLGGLDILVNNAGIYPREPFLELTERTWNLTLDINLKASCFLAQAAARRMVAAKKGGAIISMASLSVQGWVDSAHYTASKSGIMSLTRSMALELAPYGIRVNTISPGITDTAQPRGGYNEDQLLDVVKGIPIPRMGRPSEIADAAVFLASDASSYMTGQTLHVNGGAFMP